MVSPNLDVLFASAAEALLEQARDKRARRQCVDQYSNNVLLEPAERLRQLARHALHSHYAIELLQHPADDLGVSNFAHRHRESRRER